MLKRATRWQSRCWWPPRGPTSWTTSAARVGYAWPEQRSTRILQPRAASNRAGNAESPEVPANADVAQLVEHFTRNEGVPGSSPGVGFCELAVNWPVRRSRTAGSEVGVGVMEAIWKPPEMGSAPAPDPSEGALSDGLAMSTRRRRARCEGRRRTRLSSASGACAGAGRQRSRGCRRHA
jgi:hypothetical protein